MSALEIAIVIVSSVFGYLFLVGVTYALVPESWADTDAGDIRWLASLLGPALIVPFAGIGLVNLARRTRLPKARVVTK